MQFEFATAARILFGPGTVRETAACAKGLGSRVLLVTGRNAGRAQKLLKSLVDSSLSVEIFAVEGEPTVNAILEGVTLARARGCELVIGFGGGSVMDAAKAISALLTNEGDLFDYLEVVGRGRPLRNLAAPCITIPTTAGSGAEVTRNSVLASPKDRFKVSLRSPLMLPKLAIVDPELTMELPRTLTASTGLDALTQVIEPYVSCRANPLTDGVCVEGMRRVARSLWRACTEGSDSAAREDMAMASLCGGLALANAALGAVHGFAAPIGGMFLAPHGAVCAALLPYVMEVNIRALRQREPDSVSLKRYADVARLLTNESQAEPQDAVLWVRQLTAALEIPKLSAYGIRAEAHVEIVARAKKASSMRGNPIVLTDDELMEILARSN